MKVIYDALFKYACSYQDMYIEKKHIICLNTPVCSVSGEETEIDSRSLINKTFNETLNFLHDTYAGDIVILVEEGDDFALIRPPFSEFIVFYSFNKESITLWSGYYLPETLVRSPPDFDMQYLSGWLMNPAWCTPQTGFLGVNELLSGAILSFIGGVLWQRDRLSETVATLQTRYEKDFNQTVKSFRQLILNSIKHKTMQFEHKFSVTCSGGLDSSIVAIASAAIHPERPITLINCYSEYDYRGDERHYFRLIKEKIRGASIEVETNSLSSHKSLSPEFLAFSPRPCKMAAAIGIQALLFRETAKSKSNMLLTGDGGDQLFLKMNKSFIWKELMDRSFSISSFIKVISGLAIQQRRTFWSVMYDAISGKELARYRSHFFGENRFPESAYMSVKKPYMANIVPNERALKHMSATRLFQFYGMRNAEFNRIAIHGCNIQERKAFMFWPLIKASLQTPVMFHIVDGNDRAIERYAFKNELPEEIFYRKSKGAGREILSRYDYKFLAEKLLYGPVCKNKFVSSDILQTLTKSEIDHNAASALIRLSALNDWMMLYDK
ncbi:hypothetical protein JK229_21995 [Pantoea dispersa]|uniref:asparagine synthase-related protein n=1 Tax=Pantoea dispersa TaxID=59814 RepID=UPI001BA6EBC6|nr:asparagine synthase-related protein [Pantoea dispersa]MBS0907772.1 hypothetical protein [Pantoea dispersa]